MWRTCDAQSCQGRGQKAEIDGSVVGEEDEDEAFARVELGAIVGLSLGVSGRGATGPLAPEGASRRHMAGHLRRTVVGVGYSPLSSQWRNVMVTRISRDSAPAGLIRSPRMSYQRLLTSQGILAI